MAATTLSPDRLRALANRPSAPGKVLSLYLDLDPTEFGTRYARRIEINSLLDEAERRVREADLEREDRIALQADLERVRAWFEGEWDASGTRGLALFVCGRRDLFEAVGLERAVQSGVWLNDSPVVEPLTTLAQAGDWCVALVNRRCARFLRGSADRLTEVLTITDDVPGQHDQGGWSQRRYERSIENDVQAHYRHVADALLREHRRRPIGHLLLAAPEGEYQDVASHLHPYVRKHLRGRVAVDVGNSTEQAVREAATPLFVEHERATERALLDRFRAGLAGPDARGAGGLDAVLRALNDRRVEALLIEPGTHASGVSDPETGWLGVDGAPSPGPRDRLVAHDDVLSLAIEKALGQAAEVVMVRHHPDLGPYGGIGAVLRF